MIVTLKERIVPDDILIVSIHIEVLDISFGIIRGRLRLTHTCGQFLNKFIISVHHFRVLIIGQGLPVIKRLGHYGYRKCRCRESLTLRNEFLISDRRGIHAYVESLHVMSGAFDLIKESSQSLRISVCSLYRENIIGIMLLEHLFNYLMITSRSIDEDHVIIAFHDARRIDIDISLFLLRSDIVLMAEVSEVRTSCHKRYDDYDHYQLFQIHPAAHSYTLSNTGM